MILQVDKIEDGLEFINCRPKPLALYAFTKNKELQRKIICETSSGSVTFNDAILQVYIYIYISACCYLAKLFAILMYSLLILEREIHEGLIAWGLLYMCEVCCG